MRHAPPTPHNRDATSRRIAHHHRNIRRRDTARRAARHHHRAARHRCPAPRRDCLEPQVPALPASIAIVTKSTLFDERHGKRRRKKGAGEDPRYCPFCKQKKALHVQPVNPFARAFSFVGVRTYSCRACHNQFLGFAFLEGPHFTWKQLGVHAADLNGRNRDRDDDPVPVDGSSSRFRRRIKSTSL